MELEEIYRRDLNLLVALQILVEERSVSNAAKRLNLSQSAMSRVLGRLRELVGDPLFSRHGGRLLPTEKALELNRAIDLPLEQIRSLLSAPDFDPAACDQTFKILTTDYAMQTILPFALPRIYQEAPQVSLELLPLQHQNLTQQLTSSRFDLAICRPKERIEPLRQTDLGRVGVSCLVSQQHPCAERTLTLDDYLNCPHATIAISDGVQALINQALVDQPPRRQVLRAYHLEAAVAIVDQMPLIITVPADLAYLVASRYQLRIKPLPFEFTSFDYSMVWHPRCDHSPAQEWLRGIVKQECSRLIAEREQRLQLNL